MLLKQKKSNKLSTNFQPEPYEMSQKGQYHRNVTEVKKFNTREEQPDKSSDHEEEPPVDHHDMERRPQRNRHPPDRYGEWDQQ